MNAAYGAVDANIPQVEIFVKVKDVVSMDLFSKSDPFAVLFSYDPIKEKWNEIGRTERAKNVNTVEFQKRFLVEYFFEEVQELIVRVYDSDKAGDADLRKHDFIGEGQFTLGNLATSPNQSLEFTLQSDRSKKPRGKVVVRGEQLAESNLYLKLQLGARKLPNADGLFGKSDPYYVIKKVREDGNFVPSYTSPVIANNLNPDFPEVKLPMTQIANGDVNRPLRVEMWDKDNKKDDFLGYLDTTCQGLVDLCKSGQEAPMNAAPGIKRKHGGGYLKVTFARLDMEHGFLNYIQEGTEMNLITAIDFTASNGAPYQPNSHHYIRPDGKLNPYQESILAVGSILEPYDSDRKIPLLGFGAKLNDQICHCFNLSSTGEVSGVQGILDSYRNAVANVQLSGPSIMAPVINRAIELTKAKGFSQTNQSYTLLLILTDGVVHDMSAVKSSVVAASELPISIVLVGIGDEDFSAMRFLDSDDGLLRADDGRVAKRDIVQFVEAKKYQNARMGQRLAKEVLAEIPQQFISFMKSHRIVPPSSAAKGASASNRLPPPVYN